MRRKCGADGDTTLDNWRNRLFWFFAEAGDGTEPASGEHHAWQQVMDEHYGDEVLKKIYPNALKVE